MIQLVGRRLAVGSLAGTFIVLAMSRGFPLSGIAGPLTVAPAAVAHMREAGPHSVSTERTDFVTHTVRVPSSMRFPPFDVDRELAVPVGFSIEVHARVEGARFMAVAPNNDLLVSQPDAGRVLLIRSQFDSDPMIVEFVTGLRRPHDIVFHSIDGITYIYIAETHQINRFVYVEGDLTAHDREIVVRDLPDSSSPELGGAYGHELKNIALDENHQLYVSIASSCNACLSDTVSEPKRGAIYRYSADGSNPQLFAEGLRNAEGLAVLPGTNELWVVVNNRDDIPYPFEEENGLYGGVMPWYVDDHPPEAFTRVREGGNYGWPFCNPNPDTPTGYDNMPFDADYDFNRGGAVDCGRMDRITKGIQAHSAPLGLTWLQDTNVPEPFLAGALSAFHGSWNRQARTGYKVAYFPFDRDRGTPGIQVDFVTGWLNEATGEVWGRPVDVIADLEGNLLVSDDYSGTIYKMSAEGPPPPSTPTTNTPYSGSAVSLPGVVQAANFDNGGQEVAYYDTTSGNSGGQYRSTDVDVEASTAGGHNVGWISAGEWLKYSVNVASSGNYNVTVRVAAISAGSSVQVAVGSASATFSVPNTGDWQAWTTVTLPMTLAAGSQTMTVTFTTGGMNLHSIAVATPVPPPPPPAGTNTPYSGTAVNLPGTVAAADFDNGGQGVAYYDTTGGNSGAEYRSTDVDVQSSALGGYNVGWIAAGEWLKYSVNVTSPGTYNVTVHVAATSAGNTMQVAVGGATASFAVPNTGGWQSWTTVTMPMTLTTDAQVMTATFNTGGVNLHSLVVAAPSTTTTPPGGGSGPLAHAGYHPILPRFNSVAPADRRNADWGRTVFGND